MRGQEIILKPGQIIKTGVLKNHCFSPHHCKRADYTMFLLTSVLSI